MKNNITVKNYIKQNQKKKKFWKKIWKLTRLGKNEKLQKRQKRIKVIPASWLAAWFSHTPPRERKTPAFTTIIYIYI